MDYLKEKYTSQLTVEKTNKSDHLANYLHFTSMIDSGGKLSTRLYDKRDDFDLDITNYPFLSNNIPSGTSCRVHISQLIRYAQCCSCYDDFRYCHKCLIDKLLSQGYITHEADNAYFIQSTWLCYWPDQFLTVAFSARILSKFPIFHWIFIPSVLIILVGVELLLCVVVILYPRTLQSVFWNQIEDKIVLFYLGS